MPSPAAGEVERCNAARDPDHAYGGEGITVLSGDLGKDTPTDNLGVDVICGNQRSDALYGGQGDDILDGGHGGTTR